MAKSKFSNPLVEFFFIISRGNFPYFLINFFTMTVVWSIQMGVKNVFKRIGLKIAISTMWGVKFMDRITVTSKSSSTIKVLIFTILCIVSRSYSY